MANKVKVLYVAGSGRSGTTILSKVIGQIEGFFFGGELCNIWRYGFMENRGCGCNAPFCECQFWQETIAEAFGSWENIDGRHIHDLRKKCTFMRHIPFMLLPGGRRFLADDWDELAEVLRKLYLAIHRTSKCKVIVDSSKTAPYGRVLDSVEDIEVYKLHVVRNPCGPVYSKLQKQPYHPNQTGDQVYAFQSGIFTSALTWDAQNVATEAFWKRDQNRYLRIHYEEFAKDPLDTVKRILAFLGEKPLSLPFEGNDKVIMDQISHTVAGNPVRYNSGLVDIKTDFEWEEKLSRKEKNLVKLLTFPLLKKYGYQI